MPTLKQMVGQAVDLGTLGARVDGLEQRVEALEGAPAPDAVGVPNNTTINEQGVVEPEAAQLPIEAQGDLITGDVAGAAAVLAVGEEGEVLTVDAAAPDGIAWQAAPEPEAPEIVSDPFGSKFGKHLVLGPYRETLTPPPDSEAMLIFVTSGNGGAVFESFKHNGVVIGLKTTTSNGNGTSQIFFADITENTPIELTGTVINKGIKWVVFLPYTAIHAWKEFDDEGEPGEVVPTLKSHLVVMAACTLTNGANFPPMSAKPATLLGIGPVVKVREDFPEPHNSVQMSIFYESIAMATETEAYKSTVRWTRGVARALIAAVGF